MHIHSFPFLDPPGSRTLLLLLAIIGAFHNLPALPNISCLFCLTFSTNLPVLTTIVDHSTYKQILTCVCRQHSSIFWSKLLSELFPSAFGYESAEVTCAQSPRAREIQFPNKVKDMMCSTGTGRGLFFTLTD